MRRFRLPVHPGRGGGRGWQGAAIFEDDGYCASKEITRDGFAELIAAIQAGQVDVEVVLDARPGASALAESGTRILVLQHECRNQRRVFFCLLQLHEMPGMLEHCNSAMRHPTPEGTDLLG
jgi:hypothetical protein